MAKNSDNLTYGIGSTWVSILWLENRHVWENRAYGKSVFVRIKRNVNMLQA